MKYYLYGPYLDSATMFNISVKMKIFSKIRTQRVEDSVAKHFCQKNHCVKNFKVIAIEKTGNGDKIYRETKESLLIKKA